METGETLAGAEFDIYGSHMENGELVRDEKPLNDKPYVTGQYGKLTIELDSAGTYYYRETKAPAGYICASISTGGRNAMMGRCNL